MPPEAAGGPGPLCIDDLAKTPSSSTATLSRPSRHVRHVGD